MDKPLMVDIINYMRNAPEKTTGIAWKKVEIAPASIICKRVGTHITEGEVIVLEDCKSGHWILRNDTATRKMLDRYFTSVDPSAVHH